MRYTPPVVRAILYQFPDWLAEYEVRHGGAPDDLGMPGERSGISRPTEREAIRLEKIATQIAFVRLMLLKLPKAERRVVEFRYFQRAALTSIGKALGFSVGWVWKTDDTAIRRLCGVLNELDERRGEGHG